HHSIEAKPLNLVRADVSVGMAAVVRTMMAKDPAERYQTPMAVVHALAQFVKQEPKGELTRKLPSWLTGSSVAAGLLLIGFLGFLARGVIRVKTPEGTLVVQVNVPNPDVSVDGERIAVSWDKGGKKAEIRVQPGTRELRVTKDGFAAFGEKVELSDGQRRI